MDAEAAFGKTQHPYKIKTLSKLGTEENFFKFIKNTYKNLTASTMLHVLRNSKLPL